MAIREFGIVGAALLVALLATAGGPATAAEDETAAGAPGAEKGIAARGEVLAKRWCADCHVVTADQAKASADAPSFFALTGEPIRSPEALAVYLALPDTVHARMPDLNLSRVEIADIVAYVASLKK